MILHFEILQMLECGIPRMSGDDPNRTNFDVNELAYSPHERG